MNISEDYVSFELAKLLKEKGFHEPCIATYNLTTKDFAVEEVYQDWTICWKTYVSAPTLQMACKWLREEKKISIIIEFDLTKRGYCPYVYQLDYDMDWVVKWRINTPMKYEEAIEAALKYTLENLI